MLTGLNHNALLAFATRLVGHAEAEDLVQDAYVRMLSTGSPFAGDAEVQTWACAVVKRLAIDRRRAGAQEARLAAALPRETSTAPRYDEALDAQAALDALTEDEQALVMHWAGTARSTAIALGWTRWKVDAILATLRGGS